MYIFELHLEVVMCIYKYIYIYIYIYQLFKWKNKKCLWTLPYAILI